MKNKFFKKQMKFAGYEKGMVIIMKKNIKKGFALLLIISMLLVSGIQGQAAVTKVSYRYKTYDRSKTYKGKKSTIKDIEKYKRVILKGNTTAVKKINKVLKADCNLKLKDMPYDHAMYDAETMTYDSAYYNVYTSKVTYNAKGCISIDISYEWYQGGTLSYGHEGFTLDLNSGERSVDVP